MKKRLAQIMSLLTAGMLAGCVGPKAAERSAKGKLLQDAEKYVSELREQNKLPGFSNNEHGRLIAATPWRGGEVSYPASVTIRAWKDGEKSPYCYALVKNDQQASWQVVSATRLDNHGKVIDELSTK